MIQHDVKQGSDEWFELRLGIPTASRFKSIISPKTLNPLKGAGACSYLTELLSEWMFGLSEGVGAEANGYMERGSNLERSAKTWYELTNEVDIDDGKFCTTDDGKIGSSPDGLVGPDGCVEIKTLCAKKHIAHTLGIETGQEYLPQVYGHLFVTGREWCDLVIWHPVLTPVVRRYRLDRETKKHFHDALYDFVKILDDAKDELRNEKKTIDETLRDE